MVSAVDPAYGRGVYSIQSTLQDVKNYFSRPVAVATGAIPLGSRGTIYGADVKWDTLVNQWTTGSARLLGAYGIRAKIVYTFQIAATPFHQGLVCLSFQYGYQSGATGVYNRITDPCTATNLPHVVLDLSVSSMVQLSLPYLSPMEYGYINNKFQNANYGKIGLTNLVPMAAVAGLGTPTFQLYVHLEDIELFGAMPQTVVGLTLNAGRKVKVPSPVAEEFESETHPYSSALNALSSAVHFIGKGIPELSSIAGPTSWALGKAAGVLRYFGYGKPAVTDPVMRTNRIDGVGEWNTDVATSSLVMAATATNTTAITTDVGSSNVDEMALAYVLSRWSQLNVFAIDTSTAAGTVVYGTAMCPDCFWFRAGSTLPAKNIPAPAFCTATTNAIQPSHIMWAASMFKQWRGTFKFRFTFAKTKMHAGRVMVGYAPDLFTPYDDWYRTNALGIAIPQYGVAGPDPFAYSAIFDLKDGNVFDFEVPFISPTPYVNYASNTGGLVMYVVNPILAPSLVSSTVEVLVEVSAGGDFELANPAGVYFPASNTAPVIALQSGRLLSDAPESVNQKTMGEAIVSVKQMIAIPHTFYLNTRFSDLSSTIIIPPWFYQPSFAPGTPSTTVGTPHFAYSYGGNWASCYGFLKGGTDAHIYCDHQRITSSVYQLPSNGAYVNQIGTNAYRSWSNAITSYSTQKTQHLRLPAFFPTTKVFSWIANNTTADWYGWTPSAVFPNTLNTIQALYRLMLWQNDEAIDTTDSLAYLNRNAADDAQLAMYIGPPPIWLPPPDAVSSTSPPDPDSLYGTGSTNTP